MGLASFSDYGQCPCGGVYEPRGVEVRFTREAEVVVMSDVPQGACPDCGSRIYKAVVLETIEAAMRGSAIRDPSAGS